MTLSFSKIRLLQYALAGLLLLVGLSVQATPAAPSLEKVTLQLKWLHQFQFAGYYAAKIQGFYEEEGLDVEIRQRDLMQNQIHQVINGDAEYGVSDSILLLYQARKEPVVIVAPIFQHSPQVFITLDKSGIQNPYDLQNKDVAFYYKDTDGFSLLAMLEQIDVQPNLKRVVIDANPESLVRGDIVAYPGYLSNEPYLLAQQGHQVRTLHPLNYGIDLYGDMLFTSQKEVQNHPGRVERFKRATLRGWEYALNHKQELAEYIKNELDSDKTLDHLFYEADVIERVIDSKLTPLGTLDEGRLRYILDLFKKHGLTDKSFSLQDGIFRSEEQDIQFTEKELRWIKQHPVVKVAVDRSWAPIEFVDEAGRLNGISASYLNFLKEKTGIQFKAATELQWPEAVKRMENRQLDLYSAVIATEERRDYTLFTQPYLKFPMVIVTQRDHPFIGDLSRLQGKKVAVVRNYAIHEMMARHYPEIRLQLVDSPKSGLKAVSQGQAYAYLDNLAVASHLIKEENFSNLQISGETPFRADVTMAVRNDWPELRSILQKAFDSMDQATRNRLTEHWLQVTYKKEVEWRTALQVLVPLLLILLTAVLYSRRLKRTNQALRQSQQALSESNRKLESLSITDHLTGCFNRGYLDKTMHRESQRINRYGGHLSLILIDLDDFKQVNDRYGHLTGDRVLIDSCAWVRRHIRETDTLGRWGGEEFVIICPDTDLKQAKTLAEKIRAGVEALKLPQAIHQTLSIGVAQYRPDESIDRWVSRTDQALYLAKHRGKNQVLTCLQLVHGERDSLAETPQPKAEIAE